MARAVLLPLSLAALTLGCSSPNSANIQLRKDNQALRDQITSLQRQHDAELADIRALQSRATTVPVLPHDRIDKLFTTHGLKFGILTGGADLDPSRPGDEGIKISIVPIDEAGQPLKAAGSFVVEAFDLADPAHPQVGSWTFPLRDAGKNWYGQGLLYNYVLNCPWQHGPPAHGQLTVKVTFTDALTQRQFEAQKQVTVSLSLRNAER